MKRLLPLALILFTGCALQRTTSLNPQTHEYEAFTQIVWFQKGAAEGLKAHSKTSRGTSSAFQVTKESTETQTEALAAVVKAAVEGAVKGAK